MKTRFTFSVLAVLFTAALTPVGTAKAVEIIKGPYLQQVTQDSIVIMWETDVASGGQVDYGSGVAVGDDNVTIHEIELTGLATGSYGYTVTSGETTSPASTFTTAPGADQPFRFVAYGDSRTDYETHAAVVAAIRNSDPDIVIHTGDLVYDGSYSQWGPQFFTPAHSLMTNTPMFPVMGNHEGDGTWFREFFSLPDNEQWYSFMYGCVQFIALDTTVNYSQGSTQYSWLESQLQSNATWLIVYFHHPPYTCSSGHSDNTDVQQDLVPLFEANGVDMVFNGHSHAYERYFHNGIYYIVTGGGGAPLHSLPEDTQEPIRQVGESAYHHCVIDVDSTSLSLSARYNSGVEFDTITIEKTAEASNPNPEHEAKNVPVDTVLSWRAGIGAVSHDVYFGTNTNPDTLVSEKQTETTYDPGTLAPGITYYWKVNERNSSGEITPGVVWHFTTEATLPWSDGFESGGFSAESWSTSGLATVVSSAAYTGNYGALLKKTTWIESKAVSTVGYDSIYVKYARKTKGLDTDEYLYVEWYDGSIWHELEKTQDSSWSLVEMTCGTGAGNNANFKIKFSTNGNAGNDEAMVDDVEITNIPPAPDITPPEPDPLTWDSPPSATGPTSISMTADTASDPSGVEYYFVCTDGGGHDSGWQNSPTYQDTGLSPGTTYTYQVKAQDKSANQNVTGLSTEKSATTTESGDGTMHVGSIDMGHSTKTAGPNEFIKALATVKIVDATGVDVEGATVYGSWSIATSDTDSGLTDVSGIVTLESDQVKNALSGTTFTFTVTDVTKSGGWTYDSTVEISGSFIVP